MKTLHYIRLNGISVLKQLRIEELLLRQSNKNFYVFNEGSLIETSIVLGMSGKIVELIDTDLVEKDKIPLIRRYTGGGTVVVDNNTLFSTFIMNVRIVAPFLINNTHLYFEGGRCPHPAVPARNNDMV